MGLDLALGGLVLITAFRGWLKGFLVQAIRLGGMVASVYLAAPVRDEVKPYVAGYLPSMRPELLDRLVWWGAASASFLMIVGLGNLLVAASRRKTLGLAEANRGDQFAGLGFGLVKGAILAAFVVSGAQKHAQPFLSRVSWADEQAKTSTAWQWNEQYRPADRIWSAPPVRQFVGQIRKNGLLAAPGKSDAELPKPVQTASRTPSLAVPSDPTVNTENLDPEMVRLVESIQQQLRALEPPN